MTALHPSMRVPAWVALAVVAAAYVLRSALRGWDFRPELPRDVLIVAALVALLLLREILEARGWHGGKGSDRTEGGS